MKPLTIEYRCGDRWVIVDRSDLGRTAGRKWAIRDGVPWIILGIDKSWKPVLFPAAQWIVNHKVVEISDGNPFNLRRENIRIIGRPQPVQKDPCADPPKNKWGFRGVSRDENRTLQFSAAISIKGKKTHIGWYETAEDAARAYDAKAKELQGIRAVLNFRIATESTDIQPIDSVEADISE